MVRATTTSRLTSPAIVAALREIVPGIGIYGWHYIYGNDPIHEATKAADRMRQFGLDGYIIDAEKEYQLPGRAAAARVFMSTLRSNLPDLPIRSELLPLSDLVPGVPVSGIPRRL